MMRWVKWVVGTSVALSATAVVLDRWHILELRRLTSQVHELERDKEKLLEYARRLSTSRRMAQVDVLGAYLDPLGRPVSVLSWQEIREDGTLSAPQQFETVGVLTYFEAAVIKFTYEKIAQGTQGRETSLAFFRRVFGDLQAPSNVVSLNPAPYCAQGIEESDAEETDRLWSLFWRFIDDPQLAKSYDVRVAQVEAPAVPLKVGEIWEVVLDAAGGLNLRKIGTRPTSGRPNGEVASKNRATPGH